MRSNFKQHCSMTPSIKINEEKSKKATMQHTTFNKKYIEREKSFKKKKRKKEEKNETKTTRTLSTRCEIRGMQQNITVFY